MVLEALVGAMDLAPTALGQFRTLDESDSAFQHYFQPGQGQTVERVLELILAWLGTPNTDEIWQCSLKNFSRLHLIYGDQPFVATNECQIPTTNAVQATYTDLDGKKQPYIKFCPNYFLRWRGHRPLRHNPEARYVNLKGDDIGVRDPDFSAYGAVYSAASTTLHGM